MSQEHSNDIDAVPEVQMEKPAITSNHAVNATSEASFAASDPPSSWTWDVGGRPPGSATR
jgi:hypothetical protein